MSDSELDERLDDILSMGERRAREAIKELLANKQVTHIMGRSLDEVGVILAALDIERETDIRVTMKNLGELHKRAIDDYKAAYSAAMSAAINDALSR